MKTEKTILVILMAFIACIASAQVSVTVNVPTAGGLCAAITAAGGDKTTLTDLTVTGNIDARDVKFMRDDLPNLAALNLEGVQISAYTGSGGTINETSTYPANTIPKKSFFSEKLDENDTTFNKIILPRSIINIGEQAFQGCMGLKGVIKIPEMVKHIDRAAFNWCIRLNGLILPDSLESIGESSFEACKSLSGKLKIPHKLAYLGSFAFVSCNALTGTLILPNTLMKISPIALAAMDGLTTLVLPNTLISIEYDLFEGCSSYTGELIIPNSVTSINSGFRRCTGFTSCYIPSSLTSFNKSGAGFGAFYKCKGLKKVAIDNLVPPVIDNYTFEEVNKYSCELFVPRGSKAAYQAATGWKQFNIITEAFFVTLNTQGGHPAAPITTTLTNAPIVEPGNPIREGYFFAGWYKEADCNNPWNFVTNTVSEPATLYAKWIANPENNFTVSFIVDGGTGVSNVLAPVNTKITQPAAPTKTDCTFGGWYKEADFKDAWNFETDTVTCQTMMFAKWNVNTITVSFNVDGGTAIANIEAPVKTTLAKPKNPTKTGSAFGGWYKEPEFTTAWNFTTDVVTASVTLYAKWNFTTDIENQHLSIFQLFPNPVSTSLNLSNLPLKAEIKILSADGKLIKEVEAISTETTIEVSNLPNGIYLLKVKSKEGSQVEKFIKQ